MIMGHPPVIPCDTSLPIPWWMCDTPVIVMPEGGNPGDSAERFLYHLDSDIAILGNHGGIVTLNFVTKVGVNPEDSDIQS